MNDIPLSCRLARRWGTPPRPTSATGRQALGEAMAGAPAESPGEEPARDPAGMPSRAGLRAWWAARHMQRCSRCREEEAAWEPVQRRLVELGCPAAPPDLFPSFMTRITREPRSGEATPFDPADRAAQNLWRASPARGPALAALIVIAVAVGSWMALIAAIPALDDLPIPVPATRDSWGPWWKAWTDISGRVFREESTGDLGGPWVQPYLITVVSTGLGLLATITTLVLAREIS
ncbi:MAG: hypothetical protein H0Z37_01245 [Firmicutes bacterium]|nr:hypothetical protein [Bacillota bacterium]